MELGLTTGRPSVTRFADVPADSCRLKSQLCAARTLRCCKGDFHEHRRTSSHIDRYTLRHSLSLAGGVIYPNHFSSRLSHSIAFHGSFNRSLQCNVGTAFESPSRHHVALEYCEVTFKQTCFISDPSQSSPDADLRAISKDDSTPT